MDSVVHHRGRRYKRSNTKRSHPNDPAKSTDVNRDRPEHGFTVLPPPTPPTGKTRTHMVTSQPFQYQRFKPLPSIGRASDTGGAAIVDTDSAVDLTSPTPSSHLTHGHLTNDVCRVSQLTGKSHAGSESPQLHTDVERDGVGNILPQEAIAPLLSQQKSTINHDSKSVTFAGNHGLNGTSVETNTPHCSLPPEPSPNDEHTVTLCIRLPDGSRVQRRFNYCVDILQTVVTFAHRNLHQTSLEEQDFVLCNNSVPRVVFDDLSLRLEEVGLVHNTMLHFTN